MGGRVVTDEVSERVIRLIVQAEALAAAFLKLDAELRELALKLEADAAAREYTGGKP